MGTMQHAIEVNAPVHLAYDCLTHFEEYPRFMEDVEAVRRLDDTHLQWVTRMDNRPVEWEAEITEQQADRCIAWHNLSGPENSGRLELQALDDTHSRVTYTWHLEPQQVPGPKAGDPDELMARRLRSDLERMKDFIESASGSEQGAMNQGAATRSAPPHAGTAAVVGALGGTDAAAGAKLSGSKGGPGGASLRELVEPTGTAGDNSVSPGAGANAAGGTGLGSTASADDTRTGTGSSSGSGTALTGGGMSGAHGPGVAGGNSERP